MPSSKRKHSDLEDAADIWKKHKEPIKKLYQDDRKPLKEVKASMELLGFPVYSLKIWEINVKHILGLRKKFKTEELKLLARHIKPRMEAQKLSEVSLNGSIISFESVWKEIRRRGAHKAQSDEVPLQEDLVHTSWLILYAISNRYDINCDFGSEFTIFKNILERVPKDRLHLLSQGQITTVKAAWERLLNRMIRPRYYDRTHINRLSHHKLAFSFLVGFGMQFGWVNFQRDGPRLLYYAILLDSEHVSTLLRHGSRPDVFKFDDIRRINSLGCAVSGAIFKRRFTEAREMIRAYRLNYPGIVNPYATTTLQLFLYDLRKAPVEIFHQGLTIFLEENADVDMEYRSHEVKVWSYCAYKLRGRTDHRIDLFVSLGDFLWTHGICSSYLEFFGLPVCRWPSILDYLYYTDRQAYSIAVKYSNFPDRHVTRARFLSALAVDPDSLRDYVHNQSTKDPTDMEIFVKFLIFEQLALIMTWWDEAEPESPEGADLTLCACQTVEALTKLGVDLNRPCPKGKDTVDLIFVTLTVIKSRPHSHPHLNTVLDLFLGLDLPVTSASLAKAVQVADPGLLSRLMPYITHIEHEGTKALMEAARYNNFQAVNALLDAGVDLNYPVDAWSGDSVLARFLAVRGPRDPTQLVKAMANYLVEKGAKPGVRAGVNDPMELLIWYIRQGNYYNVDFTDTVKYIACDLISDDELAYNSGCILDACISSWTKERQEGALDLLAFFILEKGAKITSGSMLAAAIWLGCSIDYAATLFDEGYDSFVNDIWWREGDATGPLQAAAINGDLEWVAHLVDLGANINESAGGSVMIALQSVCCWDPVTEEEQRRKLKIAKYLIDHGAKINALPVDHGLTALQEVARSGELQVAVLLVKHGADVNAPSRDGTALDLAAFYGRLDTVKFLLNIGAVSGRMGTTGYDGAIQAAEKEGSFVVADMIRYHAACDQASSDFVHPNIPKPPTFLHENGHEFDAPSGSDYNSTLVSSDDSEDESDPENGTDPEYGEDSEGGNDSENREYEVNGTPVADVESDFPESLGKLLADILSKGKQPLPR
ncbi:hypothetical protein N0V82_010419 [Gnomoniopsis sp. IMI 355080]|nr:hypothetical protein N0V82_010419 [Gnomoniopsis sp. IMI 355080]